MWTILYHPKTQLIIVVHSYDCTVASTDSELSKGNAKLCQRYSVKVRGVPGSWNRYVRDIELVGRELIWTEAGLGTRQPTSKDKHCLEGVGPNEEKKTVRSAEVKPEDYGQEEDA